MKNRSQVRRISPDARNALGRSGIPLSQRRRASSASIRSRHPSARTPHTGTSLREPFSRSGRAERGSSFSAALKTAAHCSGAANIFCKIDCAASHINKDRLCTMAHGGFTQRLAHCIIVRAICTPAFGESQAARIASITLSIAVDAAGDAIVSISGRRGLCAGRAKGTASIASCGCSKARRREVLRTFPLRSRTGRSIRNGSTTSWSLRK